MTILMTALAGAGVGMAYSQTTTDRYSRGGGRVDDREGPVTAGADTASEADLLNSPFSRRGTIAGAAGLAITALGVGMMIRRRRRRAMGDGEEV